MYLWKCWHESRQRFALYATAGLVIGLIMGIVHSSDIHVWQLWAAVFWRKFTAANPDWALFRERWEWEQACELVSLFATVAATWMALTFASDSVGGEYGSGTISFLLTRPRRRASFVWTAFTLSLIQIEMVLLLMMGGFLLPVVVQIGPESAWSVLSADNGLHFLGILPGAMALGIVLYALASYLAVVTRSGTKGAQFTIAAILIYMWLPSALENWWHMHWAMRFQDWSWQIFGSDLRRQILGWSTGRMEFTPHLSPLVLFYWMALGLGLMFLSQWILERREV